MKKMRAQSVGRITDMNSDVTSTKSGIVSSGRTRPTFASKKYICVRTSTKKATTSACVRVKNLQLCYVMRTRSNTFEIVPGKVMMQFPYRI